MRLRYGETLDPLSPLVVSMQKQGLPAISRHTLKKKKDKHVFVQTDSTGSENRDQSKFHRFISSCGFTSQDPVLDYSLTRSLSRAHLSPGS